SRRASARVAAPPARSRQRDGPGARSSPSAQVDEVEVAERAPHHGHLVAVRHGVVLLRRVALDRLHEAVADLYDDAGVVVVLRVALLLDEHERAEGDALRVGADIAAAHEALARPPLRRETVAVPVVVERRRRAEGLR